MHEAAQCWIIYKNGWTPLYATISEMPIETARGFLYLLNKEIEYASADAEAKSDVQAHLEATIEEAQKQMNRR